MSESPTDPGAADELAVVGDIVDAGELHSDVEPHWLPGDLGIELPDDPEEAQQLLLREVATARADVDEYLGTVQRLAADFENFRKRAARDQIETVERASQHLIERLLPVLDNFDAAVAYEPQDPGEEKVLDGMRGTYQGLMETLSGEGLEVIPAVGAHFDTEVHQAVSGPIAEDGDLVVVQELRRGYRLQGRVIRASLVVVDHA